MSSSTCKSPWDSPRQRAQGTRGCSRVPHTALGMGTRQEQGSPLSLAVLQENGRRQKQHLGLRFDSLYSILEERKKELLQSIAREQEEKVQRVRGLIRQYGDHLEASSKLVETAIQAMEEPQMAVYLQVRGGKGPLGCWAMPGGQVQDSRGGWGCPWAGWWSHGARILCGAGAASHSCAEGAAVT